MYLSKTSKSKYYQCEIWVEGVRFPRSTGRTSRREAEIAAREIEKQLIAEHKKKQQSAGSLALNAVAGRYMSEYRFPKSYDLTEQRLAVVIGHMGADKVITEISTADVVALRSKRSLDLVPHTDRPVTPRTVNLTLVALRSLFHYCEARGVVFDKPPNWKGLKLKVSDAPVGRELHEEEAQRLDAAMRADYEPIIDFARVTGKRAAECVNLSWADVHFDTGVCEWIGKGDRKVRVVITDKVRAILIPLRGHHPEKVFTYVARITHRGNKDRPATVKGERLPITIKGLREAWARIRKRAQVEDFRLHDYRHNAVSKVLRVTGNLALAQKLADHASSKTTSAYYTHVNDAEVGAAMDAAARDKNPRSGPRGAERKVVKMPAKSA